MSIAEDQSVLADAPVPMTPEAARSPRAALVSPAPPAASRRWRHGILLLAIIIVGGAMRFSYLHKPPIWFDEAATFGRVCGTYQQMLDALEEAGFGPLHYHLEWWIKN